MPRLWSPVVARKRLRPGIAAGQWQFRWERSCLGSRTARQPCTQRPTYGRSSFDRVWSGGRLDSEWQRRWHRSAVALQRSGQPPACTGWCQRANRSSRDHAAVVGRGVPQRGATHMGSATLPGRQTRLRRAANPGCATGRKVATEPVTFGTAAVSESVQPRRRGSEESARNGFPLFGRPSGDYGE